jgi:dTDP-4-amino-4,6-dideoxygalactose transaminase
MKTIPYGRQYINNSDIKLVASALKENFITTGDYVKKFENDIKNKLGSKFALTCSSGTSGLHLAFKAIDLNKNDIIVMPAINFVAAYNMSKISGAKIFLADVDKFSGQMTPDTLLACIKKNKLKKIKAILTMYMGGFPENVVEFYKIKKKYRCFLIEDACHALGSKYEHNSKDIYIGSCKHSDIAVFSFHPVKTITTGEGGLVTTNNKIIYQRILELRSHGIIRDKKNYHWKYDIHEPGFNYRLSDINCALGISQLKKINSFISYRSKIFRYYKKNLEKFKIIKFPKYNNKNYPSYHLFLISINFRKIKSTKDKLLFFLKNKNIIAQYHYIPLYKLTFFGEKTDLINAEYYYKNTFSLPIYYNLKIKLLIKIIKYINIFLKKNNLSIK